MSLTAVDLFAGAGGATQGLRDAGFDVVAAVELDATAAETWRRNHPGAMIEADIRTVSGADLLTTAGLEKGELDLLKACPPCQGFSTLRGSRQVDEARNDLVLDTLRLVDELAPRAVLIENVPGLRRDERFNLLKLGLSERGYGFQDYAVSADELGVPQRRRRLVVIAAKNIPVPPTLEELIPSSNRRKAMSAGEALLALARTDGETELPARRPYSDLVSRRIAAIPVNGSRFDLPKELQLECHKELLASSGAPSRSAGGSYGRVKADRPAPTMTTRCTTPACGSFIHPTEHRGLSLAEAAAFQTFPASYKWAGTHGAIERQIGNAVPVWMAEELGKAVVRLLETDSSTIELQEG